MEDKKMQTSCSGEEKKQIKGVVCDVKNCVYHHGQNNCYAGCISVGPREADCSANTNCVTFKPKDLA